MIFTQCKKPEHTLTNEDIAPFGVCYSKITPQLAEKYNTVIIEPDLYNKSEIMQIKALGAKVFGYMSVGEVDPFRWYFPKLEKVGFAGKNNNWGSYYIDLSKRESKKILLDEVLPEIAAKGFDGIFLDTVDAVAPYTDRKWMQEDMAEIIQQIKQRFPSLYVIQNAGFFLLDKTHPFVDAVMIENVVSDYDFLKQNYILRDSTAYTARLRLMEMHAIEFDIPFIILDFAPVDSLRDSVAGILDRFHYPYFISTISLDTLPGNPEGYTNNF